ncbi:MAG: hypothetical protein R6X19_03065 [Kiritimatiellia bacterium]
MTPRRLYIHIGHPKTGTTSIQTFLLENRDALRAEGILVPRAGVLEGAHHGLSRNWYAIRSREDRSEIEIQSLRREAEAAPCPVVVLSSEAFIQEQPARFASLFSPSCEVFIIYYIRRQDLVAESDYAQRVRSYIKMEVQPARAILPVLVPHYLRILARYGARFDRAHLLVRPFEKTAFHGGSLLSDFLTLIGADPSRHPAADRRRNTSFTHTYLEFKRACNLLPLLEAELKGLGAELDRLSEADAAPHPGRQLSQADRSRILADFATENEEIARTFLGRPDGALFTEPPPEDDTNLISAGCLPPETQHAILSRLSPGLQKTLEFLDRGIRLRLPGEAFLPEIPADPAGLRQAISKREQAKLRRRIHILERRFEEAEKRPPPAPPARLRRLAGRLLRRLGLRQ